MPHPLSPGRGEVLVEVSACAVCRTDLQLVTGDLPAHRLPVVPGHQVVGTVTATGDDVDRGLVGRRVGLAWLAGSCGGCRFCRTGRENLCRDATFTGWDRDGGYATHVVARADVAFPLPDIGWDDAALAPLLCGGVIGYRSLRVAGVGPGDTGLRLGLYGFGASATVVVQLARYWGVEPYVVTRSHRRGPTGDHAGCRVGRDVRRTAAGHGSTRPSRSRPWATSSWPRCRPWNEAGTSPSTRSTSTGCRRSTTTTCGGNDRSGRWPT